MGSLQNYRDLEIDWSMTPWDAVTLYLEWGNNSWHANHQPVRSKADFSNYFVVYTWDKAQGHPGPAHRGGPRLIELDLPGSWARTSWSPWPPEGVYPPMTKSHLAETRFSQG
jgi:hypothetical protein